MLFGGQPPHDLRHGLVLLRGSAVGGVEPFVSADEEGGAVQRLRGLVGDLPSARAMAATMTTAQVRALARRAGAAMLASGIDVDLAPVLDLDAGPGPDAQHPDGTRSFSADPEVASRFALAFAAGLTDAGVVAVAKHAPGLGSASGNTDATAATVRPWPEISSLDLQPFRDAVHAGVRAIMVSNAVIPRLTTVPADLSPQFIDGVLRDQLGYTGVIITDSLSANAVASAGYPVPRAVVAALKAGADMALFGHRQAEPATTRAVLNSVEAAVADGSLPLPRLRDAVLHVLALKHLDLCAAR